MSKRHFGELLKARFAEGKTVCVGLDLDRSKFPPRFDHRSLDDELLVEFATEIIEATADIAVAYKPNSAFYEAYGPVGMSALARIIQFIHEASPGVPIILDNKRGDIGKTNNGYVRAAFELFHADAVTVSPYLGQEALRPFLDREEKGIIVLCRTSNEGAGEFQDRRVLLDDSAEELFFGELGINQSGPSGTRGTVPFYQLVAYRVAHHWNQHGNCALVVGATYPEELGQVRRIAPDMPLLIPGIGAQGGDVEATVRNGRDANGQGMIINSSSGIANAEVPRTEALRLDGLIRQFVTA